VKWKETRDAQPAFKKTSSSRQSRSERFPAGALGSGGFVFVSRRLQQIAAGHAAKFIDDIRSRTAKQNGWRRPA
jgi:hypothetical protein